MDAAQMVRQWQVSLKGMFGNLHGHGRKALACFSFAMCLSGHCHSGRLAAATGAAAKPAGSRRRWERLLANDRLDGSLWLRELSRSLLKDWAGRQVLLVLDETPNGEGLRCMRLGVAYRKRLISIDAVCYPTDQPPMSMPRLVCRMLRRVARLMPSGMSPILLADRGLSWPAVCRCLRRLDWGHVMRLQHSTRMKLANGQTVAVGTLVSKRGQGWHGEGEIFKKAGWQRAHVTAVWEQGMREPWLLAAREDGPGGLSAALAYARRNWCEQTFRDEKSGGFQWQQSRVTEPRHAQRLVLVMALATLLSISLGMWLIKTGRRRDLDPHRRRRLSVFQLGLRWLRHMVLADRHDMPKHLPYLHPT